ncbi:MAG: nitroreductase family deazaflavin-dependent oxidoreductase [Ilumatobacteraceae bacterium]|jgi:deazaflavin-dependent oxidoreductase (nitroreductase family)|nr:nitroreductase family deazaflavin-dependent oxidoreductase [Ilumatobacteraceae bacterium]MDP4702160.1 nitroreductase family deazaflavin-dependent oxidoreductase [Ilumatobacteraceae bacterium]MDP5108180.1 nitroreductase family deazaflavin-dependent oxidoreductase [Ilumatobacteraceae bacterium]
MSEILESPIEFVANHIKTYVATNGEDGHIWQGVPCLLLTTTGRKSGAQRRCALIYGMDGNDYIVVASRGGDANHPLWYKNMLNTPQVTLQVKGDVFQATASTIAEGANRDRLWNAMAAIWPDYNTYAEKTERRIPLVRLTRI